MGYQQMHAMVNGENNNSCIKRATKPVMHKRRNDIDRRYRFKGETVDDSSVQLVHSRNDQLAGDILTKVLPQVKIEQH